MKQALNEIGVDGEKFNNEIVSEMISSVKLAMYNNEQIKRLVKKILNEVGIEPSTVLRRDRDGVSEASWLVEKMIGEFLIDGKIGF